MSIHDTSEAPVSPPFLVTNVSFVPHKGMRFGGVSFQKKTGISNYLIPSLSYFPETLDSTLPLSVELLVSETIKRTLVNKSSYIVY